MSATARTNGRTARVPAITQGVQAEGMALAAAVLRVQAAARKLTRNAEGQIGSRTYGYVTLDAVVDEVLPLLVEHELLWRTFPTFTEEGAPGLRYRMTHVPSGQSDEDVMPLLGCTGSQALGSAVTYDRRYALTAYLNLTVDPDDDGAAASARAPVDRYAEAEAAAAGGTQNAKRDSRNVEQPRVDPGSPQPTARPPEPSERRITANQRTKLLIPRAQEAKLTDGEFANVILAAAGDPPRSWRSPEHATQTLERLLDQLPVRLKDSVLDGIAKASTEKGA